MGEVHARIAENRAERREKTATSVAPKRRRPARYAPAGQSTQMIVGADDADA